MAHLLHTDQSKNYCPESLTYRHPLTEVVTSLVSHSGPVTLDPPIEVYTCPHCRRESEMWEIQAAKRSPFNFGFTQ